MFSFFQRIRSAVRPAASRPRVRPQPAPSAGHIGQRRPENDRDKVLSSHGQTWLNALPAAIRPTELCTRYPRVANRLALCWSDHVLSGRLLEDLLVDRRGARKGFPPAVAHELMRLRQFHDRHRPHDAPVSVWDLRSLAPSDR